MNKFIPVLASAMVVAAIGGYYYLSNSSSVEYRYDYIQSMGNDCQYNFATSKAVELGFMQSSTVEKTKYIQIYFEGKKITTLELDLVHDWVYYPNVFNEDKHRESIIRESGLMGDKLKISFYPFLYLPLLKIPSAALTLDFTDENGNSLKKTTVNYDLAEFNAQTQFPEELTVTRRANNIDVKSQTSIPYNMELQWKYNADDAFEHKSPNYQTNNEMNQDFPAIPTSLSAIIYTKDGSAHFKYKLQIWNTKESQACLSDNFIQKLVQSK